VAVADGATLVGVGCWLTALIGVGLVNRGAELACDIVVRRLVTPVVWAIALCLAGVGVAVNSGLLVVLPDLLHRVGFDASISRPGAVIVGGLVLGAAFTLGFFTEEAELFVEKGPSGLS
jgi:hypothetical protein